MKVLSVRCSNNDYCFAVLSGTKLSPQVEETGHVSFPKGFSDAEAFRWLFQEIGSLTKKYQPDRVVVKGAEPAARSNKELHTRIGNEAIVFLAAILAGATSVLKKINSTIAKDLGLKGKAKYLKSQLDTSPLADFEQHSSKEQEALIAGWSGLE
jgi:hypothetical protein